MSRATMVVYSSPVSASREHEYNAWYDDVHLPDVCAVAGVTGAARFRLADTQVTPNVSMAGHRYMAMYELDAPDIQSVLDEITARSVDGRMRASDAIDIANPPVVLIFEAQ